MKSFCLTPIAATAALCVVFVGCQKPTEDIQIPDWIAPTAASAEPVVMSIEAAVAGATSGAAAAPFTKESAPPQTAASFAPSAVPAPPAIPAPSTLTAAAPTAIAAKDAGRPPTLPELTSAPAYLPLAAAPASLPNAPPWNASPASDVATSPAESGPIALSMDVRQGDRIPYRRTVDTTLAQSRADGAADVHRTRSQFDLTLTAVETSVNRVRWSVRFDAVRVSRNFDGRQYDFRTDGLQPVRASDDPEVAAYEAMIGKGFVFSLDRNNNLVGVEGFDEFLSGCLGDAKAGGKLPPDATAAVGDFVSEAIGLLRFGQDASVGDTFARSRMVIAPSPVRWSEELRLTNTSLSSITLKGVGSVSEAAGRIDGTPVRVLNGTVETKADIFRDSGLPKSFRRTETLEMSATLSDGQTLPQSKTTVCEVEAFPRGKNF